MIAQRKIAERCDVFGNGEIMGSPVASENVVTKRSHSLAEHDEFSIGSVKSIFTDGFDIIVQNKLV